MGTLFRPSAMRVRPDCRDPAVTSQLQARRAPRGVLRQPALTNASGSSKGGVSQELLPLAARRGHLDGLCIPALLGLRPTPTTQGASRRAPRLEAFGATLGELNLPKIVSGPINNAHRCGGPRA